MGRLIGGVAAAPTVAWTAPPTIGRAARLRGGGEPGIVAAPGQVTPDGTYWKGPGVFPTAAATRSSRPDRGVSPRSAGKGPGGGRVRPAAAVLLDNPNIPAVAGRRPR